MSFEVTDFGGGEITVTETVQAEYCIEASEDTCTIEVYETGLTGATGPQGPQGAPGQGVPIGGTTGQVLSKNSNTNYDTEWTTPSGGTFASLTDLNTNLVSGDFNLKSDSTATITGDNGSGSFTYVQAANSYYDILNDVDGEYSEIYGEGGATPHSTIYLGNSSGSLENRHEISSDGIPNEIMYHNLSFAGRGSYNGATTELLYGRVGHRIAISPPGNIKINKQKSGDFFYIHNATGSGITFSANTTETFNGASTYILPAGKFGLFIQYDGLGIYQIQEIGNDLPAGGTTGQILKKSSNTDYDTEWANTPTFLTSILGLYKIDANSVGGDPSNGYIRYNNATQTSSTALHIDADTDSGLDITHFLELLAVGNLITIQDKNNSLNLQTWEINSQPTLTGDYFIFPVTLVNSSGTGTTGFSNNSEIILASFGAAQTSLHLDLVSYTQFGGF